MREQNTYTIFAILALTLTLLCADTYAQPVHMPDPNLRAVIREELNIADRPEVRLDARMLRRLRSLYGFNRGISDLTGLEHATSLMHLSLHVNEISDVRPLAPLVKLTHIRIHNNQIEDVSPLGNLTALETLLLGSNKITDVRPLGNLIRLTTLMLDRNKIVDISALGNLVNLDDVSLVNNRIVDHSPVLQLSIANLEYDQTCDMPPLPLLPRLENRSFPSIVAPIGGILNRPDLSGVERLAYHDLYFCCLMFGHRFFNTGSGWQVRGDYDTAVRSRDNVLAHNPNMIFIAEVRMQNEGGGYPLPDSPDWVWLRDSQGSLVYQGERRVINFTHPQVKEMIVEQANAVSKCGLYDGIFLDWWNEYDPTLGDSIDNQIQQQARDDIIQRIRATTRPDFLILGNTNRRKTPRNAPHINGGFMETLVPRDASAGHVETLLAEVESSLAWLETHLREPRINSLEGWAVPTESLDSPTNLRWMRAFTTLSLTHSDGYVVFTRGGGHNHYWYDFWDAELGRPVGEKGQLYQETDGLYIREFTNGWAAYNHSGSEQQIILPELAVGVASRLEGNTHALPDIDGEMYLRVKPTNPADVNGDGVVNILDLVVVAQAFGKDGLQGDVNGDGVVNVFDLVFVANQF